MAKKKKLLIFHPALAPYRIDLFNSLNENFDASFYFFNDNLLNQKFDQNKLKEKIKFKCNYLKHGINLHGRSIRIGIYNIIRKEKPEIVLCPEFNLVNIFVVVSNLILNRRLKIYTICDDNLSMTNDTSIARKLMRATILKFVDGIIFSNKAAAEWYANNWNKNIIVFPIIRKENLYFEEISESIPIAIRYIKEYNLGDKKVFLFVGRLVKEKNLERLIEAFSIAIDKHKEARLVIVGGGNLEQKLFDIAKKNMLDDYIIFTGRLEGKELLAWYVVSGILVLPSISESFGAVINEALLVGCYVLASKISGASSLVQEGTNGMLIDPFDVNNIAQRMIECINNDSLFSDQGRIRKSRMLVNYDDLINSCIKSLN